MLGRETIKAHSGNELCDECEANTAVLVKETRDISAPFMSREYFCQKCHDEEVEKTKRLARSPEVIEETRQMLLDEGMDAKEVNQLIMRLLNPKS